MVLSAGDLAFLLDSENLELYRVVSVNRDNPDMARYDLAYCCEFLDRSDPKSIKFCNREFKSGIPEFKVSVPDREFVYSYMSNIGNTDKRDLQYSIRGRLI